MKKVKMVDTHCHLASEEFSRDRPEVIDRASRMGIVAISSAIMRNEWDANLEIARQFASVFASAGLDPECWNDIEAASAWIQEHSQDIVAIGEVGLDHYRIRDHDEREEQKLAFVQTIELANDLKIPLQVHSRSAGAAALQVLEDHHANAVHMHAFDGKAGLARSASRDLGYYFSIPPSVVRSPQKRKLVKAVDIEKLLVETDSPVLAAERGARNEPANLIYALSEIARILGREEEELREITLQNTLRLYSRIG